MGSKREFNRAAIKKNFLEQIFASGLEIEWIENSGELNFTVQYCIFCDMEYNVRVQYNTLVLCSAREACQTAE